MIEEGGLRADAGLVTAVEKGQNEKEEVGRGRHYGKVTVE